jgi:putative ABC transport system substrate-binding protein
MKRRDFITLLSGAAAWPVMARAQQPQRMRRIGVPLANLLDAADAEPRAQLGAIRQGLREMGWVEGRNLEIAYRRDLGELIRLAPEVILSTGTPMTAALQRLTTSIPIVFVSVSDPLASGFVTSFARPGGNVTGFTSLESSLAGKWLSLLKDMAPNVTRVMFLYSLENSNWSGYVSTIEAGTPAAGVVFSATAVASFEEIGRSIEAFARDPNGGMIVQPTGLMINQREKIAALAVRHRLPAIYPYEEFAVSGGLASYGPDTLDLYRRATAYVDRILKGEKPSDLPVQAPTKFELVINLKAAKAIGLEVPYSVLILADKLID